MTDGVERYQMLLCVVALVVLAGVISFLIYVSTDEGREARTYRNSPLGQCVTRRLMRSSVRSISALSRPFHRLLVLGHLVTWRRARGERPPSPRTM